MDPGDARVPGDLHIVAAASAEGQLIAPFVQHNNAPLTVDMPIDEQWKTPASRLELILKLRRGTGLNIKPPQFLSPIHERTPHGQPYLEAETRCDAGAIRRAEASRGDGSPTLGGLATPARRA